MDWREYNFTTGDVDAEVDKDDPDLDKDKSEVTIVLRKPFRRFFNVMLQALEMVNLI